MRLTHTVCDRCACTLVTKEQPPFGLSLVVNSGHRGAGTYYLDICPQCYGELVCTFLKLSDDHVGRMAWDEHETHAFARPSQRGLNKKPRVNRLP